MQETLYFGDIKVPTEIPFTRYRAHYRLRYLWKLFALTGKHMTASTVKQLIIEMMFALHDATPDANKQHRQEAHGEYTNGTMDGWSWQVMDVCHVMDYLNVSFYYGDITITLTYMEGNAHLSFSTERHGYNRVMEWTNAGSVFCNYEAIDIAMR